MKFTLNKSTSVVVYSHLNRVKLEFIPPLNEVVDLNEYAIKIFSKAQRVEAWDYEDLIGLIAFYINSVENLIYITNVSIEKKFQGKKIAQKLMNKVFKIAYDNKYDKIKLQVFNGNNKAIEFYKKLNFEIKSNNEDYIIMEYLMKINYGE